MPHRTHLRALQFASAFRAACLREPYTRQRFFKDLSAGVAVGIIAIPLAMALAIASGVPPQHGLYTAMIAGVVIAFFGGSRYSISGPTAAFVVILFPIAERYGLGGLLTATLLSGLMLIAVAVARLGRLIEYIPASVTLGFTGGIAIVIATLQIKDFAGLSLADYPESYLGKLAALVSGLPDAGLASLLVGGITLLVMIFWPRLKLAVPPHLPAVLVGVLVSQLLAGVGHPVDTVATRFSYLLPDGQMGHGIPPFFPQWVWPWAQPGADGLPLVWSWQLVEELVPAAFSIAMLGAIESLLCAVVLDGMSGRRHQANGELLGQGIGNLVVPFFGGITATAAIARSAANFKAGAESPVAAMIHGLVVMLALVGLAPLLGYLPMPSMAALLIMVAWNMSEAHKSVDLVKTAPTSDVLVFVICLSLTVLFDMVIAITTGVVLASLLFMRDLAGITKVVDITDHPRLVPNPLPVGWSVIKINGPLFFAAADRVFGELEQSLRTRRGEDKTLGILLYMDAVPLLDAGGLSAFCEFARICQVRGTHLVVADLQYQPLRTMARAQVQAIAGVLTFYASLADALTAIGEDKKKVQPESDVVVVS